jgi:hypothetical protein
MSAPQRSAEQPSHARWLDSRWLVPAVLALPFLVMVAALRGLSVTLPIFHSTDEGNYIYPTILQFARQLPFPDLNHYVAAQTPLFPLLEAYVGKLTGYALWTMRLVEVVISYLLAIAVYRLLERRLRLARLPALALSLLFVLSPYVFGTSFRAITDNLATLFIVLSLERFERFRESQQVRAFLAGCVALAAAMLTRQSAAFMLAVAAFYGLWVGAGPMGLAAAATRRSLPWRGGSAGAAPDESDDRAELALARPVAASGPPHPAGASAALRASGLLLAVAVSAIPVGALFLAWHGLVPPGGDPSSCALCAPGRDVGATAGALVVQTPELALATLGLYGTVLFAPALLSAASSARGTGYRSLAIDLRGPAVGLVLGALLLAIFPAQPGEHSAGVLWNAAKRLPTPLGSSLLFWVLVPLSGAVIAWRWRVTPHRWLLFSFLTCFLVGALAIRYPWQKYVDPFVLLALFFTVRRGELGTLRELAGAAVLALAFIAYAVTFVT